MANATGPFGLRPVRHLNGSPWNGQTVRAWCSESYATALYVGDPILYTPTLAEKDTGAKYPTVNLSALTNGVVCRGVIVGFECAPSESLERIYRPASKGMWAHITCGADIIYHIRDDGSGTPAEVFVGQNAEGVNAGGSTVTGLSGFALDGTTPTTTQGFPLHILGIADIESNELADYAIWEVLLNTYHNATGLIVGITAS